MHRRIGTSGSVLVVRRDEVGPAEFLVCGKCGADAFGLCPNCNNGVYYCAACLNEHQRGQSELPDPPEVKQ